MRFRLNRRAAPLSPYIPLQLPVAGVGDEPTFDGQPFRVSGAPDARGGFRECRKEVSIVTLNGDINREQFREMNVPLVYC